MRLTSLQLTRYGPFEAEQIAFDPRPGCINLLLAPNGAGKSVLRQAFCDLLFGIGGQTPMAFRYGYTGMRVFAEALAPDGTPFAFGRRKGQGNTLLDADGNAVAPGSLAALLGQTDRALLERLFALDTDRLRKGGVELLATGGALADALLSAGGMRTAKRLRQSLEEARDSVAPTTKSGQKQFYRTLDSFVDARKRAANGLLRPDDWSRMERALGEAEDQQAARNLAASASSARIARLQRIRRVRRHLAERDAASAWLAAHPDAPDLAPELTSALAEARHRFAIAEDQLGAEQRRREQLDAESAAITVDDGLLAEATEIERLNEQAGAVRKALADIPKRESEHAEVTRRIGAALRDLGSTLPVERAAEAIPPRAAVIRARDLIAQHSARAAAVAQAPGAIETVRRAMEDAETQLVRLPAPDDTGALAALVAEIRASGDPSARAGELARGLADSRAALAAELARLAGWQAGVEALVSLAPPPATRFERLDADRRKAAADRQAQAEHLARETDRLAEAQARLAAIGAGGEIPDEAAVAQARQHRDRGWQLIFRRAFTAEPPTPAQEQAFAGEQPLPLAYQNAVVSADALSDWRAREAELVAKLAEARRAVDAATDAARGAGDLLQAAEQPVAAADQAWEQACEPLATGPHPTIEEVRAFLAGRERVIDRREAAVRAEQAAALLERRHSGWARRLAKLLAPAESDAGPVAAEAFPDPASFTAADTDAAPCLDGGSHADSAVASALPALLAMAAQRLDRARAADSTRAALDGRLREVKRQLAAAEAAFAEARTQLGAWQAAWEDALAGLGRPAGEEPPVTEQMLRLFADLGQDCAAAAQIAERLRAMRADNESCAAATAVVVARAAADLAGADPLGAIRLLRERLAEQRGHSQRRVVLQGQIAQADLSLADLARQVERRQAELLAVLLATGAATVEAAETRLALSRERAAQAARFAAAGDQLRQDGDGLPLERLREEVESIPPDDLPGEVETAERARDAAQAEAQQAAAHASRLRLQMEQTAQDADYAAAVADQQAAAAGLGRVLEEAALLQLASAMLGQAMEAVEAKGSSALLTRIGAFFRMLTDGGYDRIVTADDGAGGLALSMIPHDFPDEPKSAGDLSEGTRDQLFLALRLAAIEEHVAAAAPLPFIGDDILQTFDDARATAAFRALLALSQDVQVILLTHHRHLLDLAATLPRGAVHVCQISRRLAAHPDVATAK